MQILHIFNLAQLASWAEFKNVQNLSQRDAIEKETLKNQNLLLQMALNY